MTSTITPSVRILSNPSVLHRHPAAGMVRRHRAAFSYLFAQGFWSTWSSQHEVHGLGRGTGKVKDIEVRSNWQGQVYDKLARSVRFTKYGKVTQEVTQV